MYYSSNDRQLTETASRSVGPSGRATAERLLGGCSDCSAGIWSPPRQRETGLSTGFTPLSTHSSVLVRSFVRSFVRTVGPVGHRPARSIRPPQGASSARYTLDEGCVWSPFRHRLLLQYRVCEHSHATSSSQHSRTHRDSRTRHRDQRGRARELPDDREASGPTPSSIRPGPATTWTCQSVRARGGPSTRTGSYGGARDAWR